MKTFNTQETLTIFWFKKEGYSNSKIGKMLGVRSKTVEKALDNSANEVRFQQNKPARLRTDFKGKQYA